MVVKEGGSDSVNCCTLQAQKVIPPSHIGSQAKERGRRRWKNKKEFLLACIGFTLGLGNTWRFPYLAYYHGGGSFLLAYTILIIVVGYPLYFLELSLGQFTSLGPTALWKCFPLAKGVGMAMIIVSTLASIYYNVLTSYSLFYLTFSFSAVLPWSSCMDWWGANNRTCFDHYDPTKILCREAEQLIQNYESGNLTLSSVLRDAAVYLNVTLTNQTVPGLLQQLRENCVEAVQPVALEFWNKGVLGRTSGIEDLGGIRWNLLVCLLVVWIISIASLYWNLHVSSKVLYLTAAAPLPLLALLAIVGGVRSYASVGLNYLFTSDLASLADPSVWHAAAEQVLFSLGASWGGLMVLGSYLDFRNNIQREAMLVTFIDYLTSIVGAIAVFSILGNMAHEANMDVKEVVLGAGAGVTFVAYSDVLSHFWVPQLWSFIFFFFIIITSIATEVGILDTALSAIQEVVFLSARTFFVLLAGTVGFLMGIPLVTKSGIYWLYLLDTFGVGFPLIFLALFETVGLMWGYGFQNLREDLSFMARARLGWCHLLPWAFLAPLSLATIVVLSLLKLRLAVYAQTIFYPTWAENVGWGIALLSLVQIPLWALATLAWHYKHPKRVLHPTLEWGPYGINHREDLETYRSEKEADARTRKQRKERVKS